MANSSFHSCIYVQHNKIASCKPDNNKSGLRQLQKLLKHVKIKDKGQALFCLEHTGIYTYTLLEWVSKKGYLLCLG